MIKEEFDAELHRKVMLKLKKKKIKKELSLLYKE